MLLIPWVSVFGPVSLARGCLMKPENGSATFLLAEGANLAELHHQEPPVPSLREEKGPSLSMQQQSRISCQQGGPSNTTSQPHSSTALLLAHPEGEEKPP